jgi:hypothetical protein
MPTSMSARPHANRARALALPRPEVPPRARRNHNASDFGLLIKSRRPLALVRPYGWRLAFRARVRYSSKCREPGRQPWLSCNSFPVASTLPGYGERPVFWGDRTPVVPLILSHPVAGGNPADLFVLRPGFVFDHRAGIPARGTGGAL